MGDCNLVLWRIEGGPIKSVGYSEGGREGGRKVPSEKGEGAPAAAVLNLFFVLCSCRLAGVRTRDTSAKLHAYPATVFSRDQTGYSYLINSLIVSHFQRDFTYMRCRSKIRSPAIRT